MTENRLRKVEIQMADIKRQVSDLKETVINNHKEVKECIGELEVRIDDFIKGADKKFASKLTEKIVYGMVGIIIVSVLYFILRRAGIE